MARSKGEVVWFSVPQVLDLMRQVDADVQINPGRYKAVEVGLRHVGPVASQAAYRHLRRLRRDEMRRILAERETATPELAPELFLTDCRPCKGTGQVCAACEGKGRTAPKGKSAKPRACAPCKGRGVEGAKAADCGACAGKGTVPLAELNDGEVRTLEGEAELPKVVRRILEERHVGDLAIFAGTRGLGVDDADPAEQLDELERHTLLEIFLGPALEVQAPEAAFPAADAGARVAGEEG